MAHRTNAKVNPVVEALRPYLEGVAKKLADDLWGPDGPRWGTTLTELEGVALDAQAVMSKKLLELGLQRQATQADAKRPQELQECPACRRSLDDPPQPIPREMQTRVGEVGWQEPQDYCSRCRRAFFPSEQKFGN
jgi:hypothetical protein